MVVIFQILSQTKRETEWVILVIMQISGGDVVPREKPDHFFYTENSAGIPKKNKDSCRCVLPGPGDYC